MDVVDADTEFIIHAEVPGFKKEDIKIQVDGNTLILSGSNDQSIESTDNFVLTRERTRQNFQRSIVLPSAISEENIDAKLDSGLLTLHVPKNIRTGKMISIQ
jgi:HSP20 family protein